MSSKIFQKNLIYYEAIQHNKKFIDLLKEKSEIFSFLLQINSGSSANCLDLNNPALSSRISMLSLSHVKNFLKLSIPKYGIRIKCLCGFKAVSFLETRITAFSEINIFGELLDLKTEDDSDSNKKYILSNIKKHEHFGQILIFH